MATGSTVFTALSNATTAPTTGVLQTVSISFGGQAVLQATSTLYLDVELSDPTNTGDPATFSVQVNGGIGNANNPIGTPITVVGPVTVLANSPITEWQLVLTSLTGGVAPSITVRGVAGE